MPKTLSMPRFAPARPPASSASGSSDKGTQRAAILLFLLAYVAILGVLFAPKGFFLAEPSPAALTAPADQ